MTWESIPDAAMPAVLAAVKDGRCVVCYGAIEPEHGGLYCCLCDDLCECIGGER